MLREGWALMPATWVGVTQSQGESTRVLIHCEAGDKEGPGRQELKAMGSSWLLGALGHGQVNETIQFGKAKALSHQTL